VSVGVVQPGEEKALGSLSLCKGGLVRRREKDFFYQGLY